MAPHRLDEGTTRRAHIAEFRGRDWKKALEEHETVRNVSSVCSGVSLPIKEE